MKQLWLLVGGNGAGKTTFYERFLRPKGLPFINADLIAKEVFPEDPETNSLKAAKLAEIIRMEKIREGVSFCFETVFSHPSKIDFIATAITFGYRTHLIWIHVDHRNLNVARVAQRVHEGGHNVPIEKIHSRIPRTIANIKTALPLCNEVWVFNNSRLGNPFEKVLLIKEGKIIFKAEDLPEWANITS